MIDAEHVGTWSEDDMPLDWQGPAPAPLMDGAELAELERQSIPAPTPAIAPHVCAGCGLELSGSPDADGGEDFGPGVLHPDMYHNARALDEARKASTQAEAVVIRARNLYVQASDAYALAVRQQVVPGCGGQALLTAGELYRQSCHEYDAAITAQHEARVAEMTQQWLHDWGHTPEEFNAWAAGRGIPPVPWI